VLALNETEVVNSINYLVPFVDLALAMLWALSNNNEVINRSFEGLARMPKPVRETHHGTLSASARKREWQGALGQIGLSYLATESAVPDTSQDDVSSSSS
jgi:hypothetical protein